MKWDNITEKETRVLMCVYLLTARNGTSNAVNFFFEAFIGSRGALKLFRIQDSYFNKFSFLFQTFFTLWYFITCLSYRNSCQKISHYSLLLNQYTNKVKALLPNFKVHADNSFSSDCCHVLTYMFSSDSTIILHLRE